MSESLEKSLTIPGNFLAVADTETGDALLLEEFMTGWSALEDVYIAAYQGTLD